MYNQLGICELFIIVTLNMYITHLSFQTKKKKNVEGQMYVKRVLESIVLP